MGHFGALGAREVLRVKHGRGQARQAGRRGRQAGGAGRQAGQAGRQAGQAGRRGRGKQKAPGG